MNRLLLVGFLFLVAAVDQLYAQATDAGEHHHHHGHSMQMDHDGMVMNSNPDRLPEDCDAVSEELDIEVHAGRAFARRGLTYGYDQHDWVVAPCARLVVTLHNDDEVRHQWMVHGLPKYLYPQGMFHLEANGGRAVTGTLILPSDAVTYLVHCDLSHHMEQGLKGQIRVGESGQNLPSIPGISGARYPDNYR